ncbi:hypothetical protein FEM48_Zijuj08G0076100 [Ziziphus jujuba var. spinosa]|uniref:Major facilitator superfamily (MFS) profile domain-containing protein n=1 Tax=Ziziphus jujuba var. spinosa TaxID=714518 RepID=A0A978UXT9_ZIZJJ|nr:hypothetical protein FEM48_Zijuj08G0076100 [Ziziphus jujuba var. spinosa]
MRGAVLAAIAAAIGSLLQGWDNSKIATVIDIKKEFKLESEPTIEGLIVAMSLIGGTIVTTFSGSVSDSVGRRPMLIMSSLLFFISALVMLWAPNVYVLLLARLLDGFGTGLAVTQVPVYISETAPAEIRGRLNTLPQFTGSSGMFLSYCMVFGMSLGGSSSWRLMLGVLSIPSLVYFALTVFFLPESPRWLVSKGRMVEAQLVLQRLRGTEDVSGELALLVEGLGTGRETSIEEYIICPTSEPLDQQDKNVEKDHIRLYGHEEGLSWVAKPVTGPGSLVSNQGSLANIPLMDPLVTLFGSVHENLLDAGSKRSMFLPNMGSIIGGAEHQGTHENFDMENQGNDDDDYASDSAGTDHDENLRSPLLSRHHTNAEKDNIPVSGGSILGIRSSSLLQGNAVGDEAMGSTSVGGGWQLVWKWSDRIRKDGKREEGLQRIYLHQEGSAASKPGSFVAPPVVPGGSEYFQAAALVSHDKPVGPEILQQSTTLSKGPTWKDLLEPGVKRALVVGIGLQILQQISGINGVLYYAPQILEQAGVAALISNMGMKPASASLFISAITTLLMLPCIAISMWLMDISGRRSLLLSTIPILIVSLILLVIGSVVNLGSVLNAIISAPGVMVYLCCFVTGYGVIPNILCSEIFPTRVRALCIAICALTYWIFNIAVTYSFPIMLNSFGLAGVFSIYAVGCTISWIFVFLKVPETKGMPLEVISEFFAIGKIQADE